MTLKMMTAERLHQVANMQRRLTDLAGMLVVLAAEEDGDWTPGMPRPSSRAAPLGRMAQACDRMNAELEELYS